MMWGTAQDRPDSAGRNPEDRKRTSDLCSPPGVGIITKVTAAMILIVEDEFLISLAITEELESHGCKVTSAYNADEAIAILERVALILRSSLLTLICRAQWTA